MTRIEGENDRRFHDRNGLHRRPRIFEPGDVGRGSAVERDQAAKAAYEAHLRLHRRRGEPVTEVEDD